LPVPVAPDEIVRKVALLVAVQEHVDAAVTGSVPVVAAALTLVVTLPSVTEQLEAADGAAVEPLVEQADAASAMAVDMADASNRR
jgi:hypothetical protein